MIARLGSKRLAVNLVLICCFSRVSLVLLVMEVNNCRMIPSDNSAGSGRRVFPPIADGPRELVNFDEDKALLFLCCVE